MPNVILLVSTNLILSPYICYIAYLCLCHCRSTEFKAACDNTEVGNLLFTTHFYILSVTNKISLSRYFPNIPFTQPVVQQITLRGVIYICDHKKLVILVKETLRKYTTSNIFSRTYNFILNDTYSLKNCKSCLCI